MTVDSELKDEIILELYRKGWLWKNVDFKTGEITYKIKRWVDEEDIYEFLEGEDCEWMIDHLEYR